MRARTKSHENASKVRLAAQEIDARKHELHEFQSTFVPIKKFGFSERKIRSLKFKSAEFLTEKFGMIMSNPGQAQLLTKNTKTKNRRNGKNTKKESQVTRWRLPNLFGPETIVKNELLPIGFICPSSSPDPLR